MYYLGIDPGQSGGIALIEDGNKAVLLIKMPDNDDEIYDAILQCDEAEMAYIEKVHAWPKQGISSAFKFGVNYGALWMALAAAEIRRDGVSPQAWQKALGIPPKAKNESKRDHKKKLLAKARMLFPKCDGITLATCDALLIALYCYRKMGGGWQL